MVKSTTAFVDHKWSPPDDDWDSAESGFSRSEKTKQKEARHDSPRTATLEAVKWLTLNNVSDYATVNTWPDDIDPVTPVSVTSSQMKETPSTEVSTPSVPPNADAIPSNYIKSIKDAFGEDVDLYNDVLHVSRHANPRDIRIAYFRRGREVLSEGDIRKPTEAATVGASVSSVSKQRFQAVSMAYEILGNSAWREEYNKRGLQEVDDQLVESVTSSRISSPIYRRSSSLGRRKNGTQNAVRWSEEVEELVFDQDPTEIPGGRNEGRRSKKNRKSKKQVLVEGGKLELHLERLDKEAEKHFVFDFLDDIEASIDEMISTGSLKKNKHSSNSSVEKKSIPVNKRATSAKQTLPVKKLTYDFEMPPDLVVSTPKSLHDGTETVTTNDDTLSTLSYSVTEKQVKKSPLTQLTPMEKVIEEEQSTLSGDRASTPASTADLTQSSQEKTLEAEVIEACDPDVWCGTDDDAYPKDSEQGSVSHRDIPLKSKDDVDHSDAGTKGDRTPEFHIFLVTYLKSLAEDLYEWGASFQDLDFETTATQAMEAMMITEADLEGMMKILRTEIDRPRF